MKEVLIKKWSKVYLFLCLCNKKKMLDKIIKDQKVKEINELLREDFFKSKLKCLTHLVVNKIKNLYNNGELVLNEKVLEKLSLYLNKDNILKAAG